MVEWLFSIQVLEYKIMKIIFDDKSYVECQKSNTPGKIMIVISAKDHTDPLKKITNAIELTAEEFKKLISDVTWMVEN
jgi:nitrate reductase NapAB chaperone NapD